MSWSYSGNPASSEKDTVRFYVQDTDSSMQMMQDEEIAFLLSEWSSAYNSPLLVAAVCAEVLAARFAREIDVSADGVSVSASQLMQRYNDLASSLRDQYKAQNQGQGPDISNILADFNYDFSIKPLNFGVGFMDNYTGGQQEYGGYHPGSAGFPNDQSWNESRPF